MKLASGWSTDPDSEKAAQEAFNRLFKKLGALPHLIFLHTSCNYDNKSILALLNSLAPGVRIQGGTSCMGIITEEGFHTKDGYGCGMLGIFDPDGCYGVGIASQGDDPVKAASTALSQALEQAERPGELPVAIIITSCPGNEELTIHAIENLIGANVPILGGTSADNDMSGQWQQFGNDTLLRDGISIAALFPSGDVSYSFHSGYEPTRSTGKATHVSGRILHEIDGRPAATVYNEWTDGLIEDQLRIPGSLVPITSFSPLGNPVGEIGGIPYFKLSYPVATLSEKALELFAEIRQGETVALMKGSPDSLARRAGKVAKAALENASFHGDESKGALMLFCAGCMLSIQDRLDKTVTELKKTLKDKPFLCSFTLGEQGCFLGGENRHGNLMIASLIFGPIRTD
ncbi:MAG: FIST C-terminal domain-containing protein [Deltaproteobacteria bacterium]|nr:FIST C-terminal domain-containing protein [Deltaproteobacteria bacterium]